MLTHLPFRYITGLVKGVFCALLITLFSCSLRMPDNIKFPPGANAVDILERFALRTFAKILAVMMSQYFFFFGFHSNRSASYMYISASEKKETPPAHFGQILDFYSGSKNPSIVGSNFLYWKFFFKISFFRLF